MSGFAEVAPYLKDPLVLSGFALFLFFGALRYVVKRLPVVSRKAPKNGHSEKFLRLSGRANWRRMKDGLLAEIQRRLDLFVWQRISMIQRASVPFICMQLCR